MNSEEFVEILKLVVVKHTINGVKKNLIHPPGRSPRKSLLIMSEWYNSLSEKDKDHVNNIIAKSVSDTVFHFLCVLDGVAAIEDGTDKGELELYFVKHGTRTLLTNPKDDFLHDIFNAE